MGSKTNNIPAKNGNNQRNTVISVKVSAEEKANLQEMADELELSLSEFMRLKGLANVNTVANHEKQLKDQEEEIKQLKVALSYYDKSIHDMPVIALHLDGLQFHDLNNVFRNYYRDNKPIEHQIIRYLVEDILTVHFDLEEITIYRYDGKPVRVLDIKRQEYPFMHRCDPNLLCIHFKEYGIAGYRDMLQVKTAP